MRISDWSSDVCSSDLFILLPLMVLTGLTMSPGMNAAWPWLLDLFGGRQSARSIHFIIAALLLAFFIVTLIMVLLAGPYNVIRSMITAATASLINRGRRSTDQPFFRP